MSIEERKRIIINFIKDHPDCTAEELVKGISEKMSRALVFRYLPELIKEKIVLDNSKNRRDHKFSINNNNLLLEVQNELERFQKAFFQLIQKTEIIAKTKDYHAISKEIGLSIEGPKNWTNEDYAKYLNYVSEGIQKYNDDLREKITFLKKKLLVTKKKQTNADYLINNVNEKKNRPSSNEIKKSILLNDEFIELTENIIATANNGIIIYKKILSSLDTHIILEDILAIFYYIRDLFFYRSIIWSIFISKEMLSKINNIIFNFYFEIQNRLIKLISSITYSFDTNNILKILFEQLKESKQMDITIKARDELFLYKYKELGLEIEMRNIINSLSSIGRELKKFGLPIPNVVNEGKHFFIEKENLSKSLPEMKERQSKLKLYYSKIQER